jgi:two-component system, OmpR family, osmolarity sensor histidine kinase EnvZ
MKLRLRDIMPSGLYWRTALIIIVPAALLQILITLVFLDDHWRLTSKRMSQAMAGEVTLLLQTYQADPTPENFERVRQMAESPLGFQLTLDADGPLERAPCGRSRSVFVDRYLLEPLINEFGQTIWYDPTCPGRYVFLRIAAGDGAVFEITARRDRVQARSGPLFVTWVIFGTTFFCLVSILFIRSQVRPIEKLADAMERFGRGEDAGHFRVRGAREVRGATHAFFDMRQRIKRHIEQRAQLLAGVSHDLRTPLTRLKLQLELMPASAEIDDAKRDLAEMAETLDEYLAFAKGLSEEAPEQVDLARLVRDIVGDAARTGANIAVTQSGDVGATGRTRALKRCLNNLIDNAAAHGDQVRVEVHGGDGFVTVSVDDNGPGIAEDQYEEAFRPFSRLDETRSRNQKGVGLGLAIARDVARGHGGDVTLSTSPLGGLRATLRLPRPA